MLTRETYRQAYAFSSRSLTLVFKERYHVGNVIIAALVQGVNKDRQVPGPKIVDSSFYGLLQSLGPPAKSLDDTHSVKIELIKNSLEVRGFLKLFLKQGLIKTESGFFKMFARGVGKKMRREDDWNL